MLPAILLAAAACDRQPQVKRNYLAELNAAALAVPEDQRAWPVYREAIMALEPLPEALEQGDWPSTPQSENWPEALAYLERNREAIEQIHAAAAMESLGFVLTDQPDPVLDRFYAQRYGAQPELESSKPAGDSPLLIDVSMEHVGVLRSLSRVLQTDANLAIASGDWQRLVRDLQSLIHVACHASEPPLLMADLAGLALATNAISIAERATHASVASDPEVLRSIQEIVASIDSELLQLTLETERLMFLDIVQRVYTDDGRGEGTIAEEGFPLLMEWTNGGWGLPPQPRTWEGERKVTAGRAETVVEYQKIHELNVALARSSLWEIDEDPLKAYRSMDWETWERRFPLIYSLFPDRTRSVIVREFFIQRVDAAEAAIAAERYRLQESRYPADLDALVPEYLDGVPTDRFTGEPLHYRLENNRPLLYSVGPDRDDDGGTPPAEGFERGDPKWMPASEASQAPDGDWILYPPHEG